MVNGDGVWDVVEVEDARALDVCDVSAGGTKQCTMLRVPPQPNTVRQLIDSVYEGPTNALIPVVILYEYLTWSPCGCRSRALFTSKPGQGIAALAIDF